jgi:peroxisomal enoyl-CoA hydratase 2
MTDAYTETLYAEDVAIGDTGPEVVVENLDRVDIAKYAGASGDFTPIHVDEEFAKEAGNQSVFAHGMLTAGFASHMVSDWLGLDAIERFRIRFEAQVWPGDTVHVSGEVTDTYEVDGEALVNAEFTAENQTGEVVLSGDVTASLPFRDD